MIIAARDGVAEIGPVLDALMLQARVTDAEVLVVAPGPSAAGRGFRHVPCEGGNLFALRMVGLREARGEIVALGEDHAVPRADWCESVLRAHAEHPEAPAIVGCLANGSDRTLSGRVNFLAFAAPFQPPMATLPGRPPPLSTLSLKRAALADVDGQLGHFEAVIVPRLFDEEGMVADDRIVVDHYQDHGIGWAITNAFDGARSAYGYLRTWFDWPGRLRQARWGIANWPGRLLREARDSAPEGSSQGVELAIVALVGTAVGLGCAVGSLAGPGRSPHRVA